MTLDLHRDLHSIRAEIGQGLLGLQRPLPRLRPGRHLRRGDRVRKAQLAAMGRPGGARLRQPIGDLGQTGPGRSRASLMTPGLDAVHQMRGQSVGFGLTAIGQIVSLPHQTFIRARCEAAILKIAQRRLAQTRPGRVARLPRRGQHRRGRQGRAVIIELGERGAGVDQPRLGLAKGASELGSLAVELRESRAGLVDNRLGRGAGRAQGGGFPGPRAQPR